MEIKSWSTLNLCFIRLNIMSKSVNENNIWEWLYYKKNWMLQSEACGQLPKRKIFVIELFKLLLCTMLPALLFICRPRMILPLLLDWLSIVLSILLRRASAPRFACFLLPVCSPGSIWLRSQLDVTLRYPLAVTFNLHAYDYKHA